MVEGAIMLDVSSPTTIKDVTGKLENREKEGSETCRERLGLLSFPFWPPVSA